MSNVNLLTNTWNKLIYGWDLERINKDLEFIIDVSHWTTHIEQFNKDKFAEYVEKRKLVGLIFKLSDSWGAGNLFYDDCAEFWYNIAQEFNLLTTGYHWLQPTVDPLVAWKFHDNWIKDHPLTLPNVADFEEPSVINATDYLWRLKTFLDASGKDSIIYTAKYYIDKMKSLIARDYWGQKIGWMSAYNLWFAWYSRYYPTKTASNIYPWSDFVGWQYSSSADYPYYQDGDDLDGTEWGVTSKGGDVNWFSKSFLDKYRVDSGSPVLPPEEPEEPESSLTYIANMNMKVREGAGTNYKRVSIAKENEEINVLDIGGKDCWIRFGDKKWICKSLDGVEYLRKK